MKRDANLCRADRAVRVVLGAALLATGAFVVRGVIGAVIGLIGAVVIFSGALGFCHVYEVCGISTTKKP